MESLRISALSTTHFERGCRENRLLMCISRFLDKLTSHAAVETADSLGEYFI